MGLFNKSKLAHAISLAQKKQPLERVVQAIPEQPLGENELVEFNAFIAREWFSEESLLLVNALYKKVKAAYLKTYFLSLLVEHPYQSSGQREEAAEFMLKQLASIKAHPSFSQNAGDYLRFEASAYIMLGRCSVEKGLIEGALADYQKASTIANQTKNAALKSEISFLVEEANRLLAEQQPALDGLGLKLKNLEKKVADQQRLLGISLELGEAENRLQALQQAHAEQEEMLLVNEQKISALAEQKNRLEEEIRLSSQKLTDAYQKKDELQNEIIGLSGAWDEYQQAQEDLAGLRERIEKERNFLEQLRLQVIETQTQLDGLVEQTNQASQIYEMNSQRKAEATGALNQPEDAAQPESAAEAKAEVPPGNNENVLLDQQLTELSQLFKDPGQLITPKTRRKKARKTHG